MKKNYLIISVFFFALLATQLFVDHALAADCLAIRKNIEAETDILQRKELAKQGINDCPNDPIINFEYAYSMERFRKYKIALQHYQVAAKLAPKYAKSYFGIGDMYMNLEKPEEAVKAYQTGLSLEPDNKRVQISLAEAKIQAKQQPSSPEEIATFVNPLEATPAAKKVDTIPAKPRIDDEEKPLPFEPTQALIMQEPDVMKPLIVNPLLAETMQQMEFDKAGYSDVTGSLDDSQMGAD